ncbi:hypothetical protein GLOIN_2v1791555 [Rhizophagus irregularis DAOM 181602=DAOM 197198]|nr:hypothetical protein GLOIN_2v1791555 [Rhizophagus irregularis DAOM 181602=DAOM 197198]
MLDRLPVEKVERIVTKIPDTDLIAASKVDSVWWQEVRQEAYKRWKNYATTIGHVQALGKPFEKGNIDWITFEDEWDGRGPQKRETIEYALSEQRWEGDPWGLGVK